MQKGKCAATFAARFVVIGGGCLCAIEVQFIRPVELHCHHEGSAFFGLEHAALAQGDVQDGVVTDGITHEGDVHARGELLIDLMQGVAKELHFFFFGHAFGMRELERHIC
jgi:hypothetical protein